MNHPQVERLRLKLVGLGYSPAYVARLCAELEDHFCSIVEQETTAKSEDEPRKRALQRLGSHRQIIAAVTGSVELTPLAHRFPLATFVLLPALLLCAFSWLSLYAANQIATDRAVVANRLNLIGLFEIAVLLWPAAAAAVLAAVAIRFRVHWSLPLLGAALFSASGLYQIDLARCAASQGVFYESRWGFDSAKFLAPWLGVLIVWVVTLPTLWREWPIREKSMSWLPHLTWARWNSTRTRGRHLALTVFTLVGLAACFAWLVESAEHAVHPADKLVAVINEPEKLPSIKLQLLADVGSRQQLELDTRQVRQLTAVLDNYQDQVRKLSQRWWQSRPNSWRPMELTVISEPIYAATDAIAPVLSKTQHRQLEHLAYRQLDWDIVFRAEIIRKLDISRSQELQLKDLFVEQIRQISQLDGALIRADEQQRREVQREKRRKCDQYHQQMAQVLTASQRQSLNLLRGDCNWLD